MELMDRLGSIFIKVQTKQHYIILTILLIPGALRALEPIDMESYDMETPELAAQSYIDESFPNSELIVAFIVNVKQEQHFTQVNGSQFLHFPTVHRITQACQHLTKLLIREKNGEEYLHQVVEF